MKRLMAAAIGIIIALAFTLSASAQCNLWVQTTCASVCQPVSSCYSLPSNEYQLANFMADEWLSFQAIDASVASKPQPKIIVTGQNVPCDGPDLIASSVFAIPCATGTFSAQMLAAGMTTQDVFPDVAAGFASPTCGTTRACSAPTDCTGGIYLPFTNPATPAPAGSGPRCKALSVYDSMMNGFAAAGITMRGGVPGVGTDVFTACGYATPGGAGSNPVITEAQFEGCILPPILALFDRYGSAITSWQTVVEPLGAMAFIQAKPVYSISDIGTYIQHSSVAIKAISPGTQIGAAYTGPSYPVGGTTGCTPGVGTCVSPANSDFCYFADAVGVVNASLIPVGSPATAGNCTATTQSTTHNYLDFVGIDVFNGSSCQGASCGVPLAYFHELQDFQGACVSTYCTGFAANTRAGGSTNNTVNMPWGVTQTDPPGWAPYDPSNPGPPNTQRPTEGDRYLGCLDPLWLTSGFRQQWATTFTRWTSAAGGLFVSLFFTTPLFNSATSQANDNCNTGSATTLAMSALAPNDTARNWKQLATSGPGAVLQGKQSITGAFKITQ